MTLVYWLVLLLQVQRLRVKFVFPVMTRCWVGIAWTLLPPPWMLPRVDVY